MPDLPTIRGGPSEAGSTPASSTGVTLTANASANTKGAYAPLIAQTAYASDWLQLSIGDANSAASHLIDLAIGPVGGGSEQVVIANMLYHQVITSSRLGATVLTIPLSIPAGVRVSARCASSVGGATIKATIQTFACPIDAPPGMRLSETLGAVTASSRGTVLNDPGATANTDGTWTQLAAATAYAYRWMTVQAANITDTAMAAAMSQLIDIGMGGSGSEQVIAGDLWTYFAVASDHALTQGWSFPCAVPAGSRISARHRASVNTAGDRRIDVIVQGYG